MKALALITLALSLLVAPLAAEAQRSALASTVETYDDR
jgi:hypothetical protein